MQIDHVQISIAIFEQRDKHEYSLPKLDKF